MPFPGDMRSNRVSNLEQGSMSTSVPLSTSTLIDTKALSRSLKPIVSNSNLGGHKRVRKTSRGSSHGSLQGYRQKKRTWISGNFYKRECFKYVEKKGRGGPVKCGCGKLYEEHQSGALTTVTDPMITWKPETCSRRLPTDAYGEIEFAEDTSNRKPYIRACHDTHATSLLKLMQEKWGLNIPNLVISVTGGAKSFYLKPRLKEEFSKGLIKAAVSTSAWIITGGTNTGVMKHVGEAVRNRSQIGAGRKKINVIGIATWGNLDNQYKLISSDGGGLYPAYYSTELSDSSKTCLDSNHSHFILIDNATTGQFGVEIEPRSRLEEAIAKDLKTESYSSSGAIGIPVVILVLEGGPNTIKQMYEAVKKGVPAVVIDGSGRAADLVAFAYKHLINDEQRQIHMIDPPFIDEVKRKIKGVWKDSFESIYSDIESLLRDEKMVTIFRLDDEKGSNDLDLAILKALLKANRSNFSGQLKLALTWNRIDVAKSEIFTEDKKTAIKAELLYEPMFTALLDDKPDFVALFLNEGLSLREFLTLDVLLGLYQGIPDNSPFKAVTNRIMAKQESGCSIDMQIVGQAIEILMGDRFKSRYRTDINYHAPGSLYGQNALPKFFGAGGDHSKMLPTPWLDLFIWAVVANRRQMAHLIWERSRENLACALMATKLLKSLAKEALIDRTYLDIGADLHDHSSEFEKIAVGILDEAQREDDNLAQTLVVKELPNFGYLTCLDIAAAGEALDFISHTSCQALLSRLWMGGLALNTSVWRICVAFFMPFSVPVVIDFHEESSIEGDGNDVTGMTLENHCENKKIVHYDDGIPSESERNLRECSCEDMQYEHVELERHVETDKDVMSRLGDFDADNDDTVDVSLRQTNLGFLGKIANFYQAPFVKFFANVVSYVTFLFLYSYTILTNFKLRPGLSEICLQVWVLTLISEEVRQMSMQEPQSFTGKLVMYLGDTWNIVDLASLSAFCVATVFRYVGYYSGNENYIIVARIILSTDVIIFIVRLLQIFSVNKHLGPKLIMIRNMLKDLKYFIFILAIFILGYGVAKQAVLFPNSSLGKALVGVLNRPYWQMYGELFIEEILEDPKNCTTGLPICSQEGEEPCSDPYGKWIAPIYMAFYMLFTNILLLNLLIAIFNYTFEKVQEDSDKVWKFQRYDLILEYHDRPFLCPPLIVIQHGYLVFRWIFQKCQCCGCTPRKGSSMRMKLSQNESEQLSMWEFMAAENYCHHTTLKESETLDERVKAIQARVDAVSEELNDYSTGSEQPVVTQLESFTARPETQGGRRRSRNATTNVDSRIARLELKMEKVLEMLIQQNQKQAAILEASKGLNIEEESLSSKITTIHIKARTSPYPQSTISRCYVPDGKVQWDVPFAEYMPVVYQSPVVLAQPVWADPNILEMDPRPIFAYNAYDSTYKVERTSFVHDYDVIDGLPQNPYGRTGIVGRGLLGKWGPNHAADPIVTRWKRSSSGIVIDKGKRVLEFIAIQRKDNHQWAIPGGMVEEQDQKISETLRREFSEEALAKLDMPPEKTKQIVAKIDEFFKTGVEVYKGYVDDPRNTDNSWMETVAVNFHDDTGEVFGDLELKAGDDAEAVRWQRVSGNIPLFASHVGILEVVSKMHDAAFY